MCSRQAPSINLEGNMVDADNTVKLWRQAVQFRQYTRLTFKSCKYISRSGGGGGGSDDGGGGCGGAPVLFVLLITSIILLLNNSIADLLDCIPHYLWILQYNTIQYCLLAQAVASCHNCTIYI
jgi:hypothetical protein